MEQLFRFLLIRPAQAVSAKKARASVEKDTPLQAELGRALTSTAPRANAKAAVSRFVAAGDHYIDSPEKLHLGPQMLELRGRIQSGTIENLDDLESTAHHVFGRYAESIVQSAEFETDEANLCDSIIAIKLEPKQHNKSLARLVQVRQVMHLLRLVAASDESLNNREHILDALNAPVPFPDQYALSRFIDPKTSGRPYRVDRAERVRLLQEAKQQVSGIRKALRELMGIGVPALQLVVTEDDESAAGAPVVTPPPSEPPRSVVGYLTRVFGAGAATAPPAEAVRVTAKRRRSKVVLSAGATAKLSADTRNLLDTAGIAASEVEYHRMVATVKSRLRDVQLRMTEFGRGDTTRLIGYAGALPLYVSAAETMAPVISPVDIDGSVFRLPFSTIKAVGVGELLLVKQQLMRYEGGDVAHIENVLKSESKTREHRRAGKTERFYLTEAEMATEEQRDLESTERFEIQIETEETLKEQHKVEAGLKVTASYGSVLEVEANAGYLYDNSKERSKKVASEFAKEVVSKSVSKYSEKIRTQETLRVIEEYEEKNSHSLNNTAGAEHVIGVYQWVNKIYQAQVFNYGLREMYEFIIPEPGAFLWEALKRDAAEGVGVEKPDEFDLAPDDLDEDNYGYYVSKYEVVGVDPPPQEFITLSKALCSQQGGEEASSPSGLYSVADDLKIEDGYQAIDVHVVAHKENQSGAHGLIQVSVGRHSHLFGDMRTADGSHEYYCDWSHTLDEEVDYIPLAVITRYTLAYSVVIEIKCRRTGGKLDDWRHKTYDAIIQAYLNKRAAWEEALAAASVQQGVVIAGQNPLRNRKLEKDELKKNCIALLSKQHFDDFDAIEIGSTGLPQTNLAAAEAQGGFIRFFEQAFEWENMSYLLYPYYWGRKETWRDKIRYDEADPMLVDFLTAGAARVVIPARNGFRSAIRHFLTTGEVWAGGELPDIDSSLYLSMAEELKAQLGAPGDEVAVDEPWRVVVPTSLVRLRRDGSLPEWQQNEAGEWVPVEA